MYIVHPEYSTWKLNSKSYTQFQIPRKISIKEVLTVALQTYSSTANIFAIEFVFGSKCEKGINKEFYVFQCSAMDPD
jgi:hypothetical protein